jgi:hypothetical protein
MKHKDAMSLVETLSGNRFFRVMAILGLSLLILPWVAVILLTM